MRSIVDSYAAPLFVIRPPLLGTILHANQAAATIFGYSEQEFEVLH